MSHSRREFLSAAATGLVISGEFSWLNSMQDDKPSPENAFLSDNFAPIREEIVVHGLKVHGQLPSELNGMFLRNGPNPQFPPLKNYHWFDGDGMLHGIRLQDGKASYRNRWVRTRAWQEANRAGKELYQSILDPPDMKLFLKQIMKGQVPFPNRANTALVWHHKKLLALWEGGRPHEIELPNLGTVGEYSFEKQLKHAFTAHPKIDPKTGEMMFFGYSPMQPVLQYSVADRHGAIKSSTPIQLPRPVMVHDMAITEKHSLFIDCPVVFNLKGMLQGKSLLKFEPSHGARIGVLPRHADGETIRWFEIATCFVFHLFNAYEQGDEIVVFGCRYQEYPKFADFSGPIDRDSFERLSDEANPIAHSWRLNLKTGATIESSLDDLPTEFPRVNEALTGRQTSYGYAVSNRLDASALLKYDFKNNTREKHDLGKGHFTGEGIFVPRKDAKSEDDGWLLSLTHDRASVSSELRIIDCTKMTAQPVARVHMPQRIPYGFHAAWVPM